MSRSFFSKKLAYFASTDLASTPTPTAAPKPVIPLFRQQAIAHLSAKQYGTVILARSLSHRFLTILFVLIAMAIVAFFMLFSTTRKAQTSGVLLPSAGVIRLLPTQTGVVIDKRVQEGQSVKAGEVLFVLSSERSASAGDAQKTISGLLESRRDSFESELKQSSMQARQRLAALQDRVTAMETEAHKLDAQIALQQQRVALSEQSYKRYEELKATNYISAAQLQDKQAELLDQRQRLAELNRVKSSGQRDLASTQADMRDLRCKSSAIRQPCSAMSRHYNRI